MDKRTLVRNDNGGRTMRALWFDGGKAAIREVPVPGTVLVRVEVLRSGICNTDLELLRGYHGFRGIPGHEFVGRATGGTHAGRRVVGEINLACRRCGWCARGLGRHCPRRTVLGILRHPGAHAEMLSLPEQNLFAVPDAVTDEQAVFIEPLAAACEILEQIGPPRGDVAGVRTAVLGDGKLALLIAQVMAQAGADVAVLGKHKDKMSLARRLGLTAKSSSTARSSQWPLVIEATGSPGGLPRALELAEPRGTIVLKSTFHGLARFDTAPLVVNEVTIVGSRCGRFPRAIEMLALGAVRVGPMISEVLPLARAPAALRLASQAGIFKVILRAA